VISTTGNFSVKSQGKDEDLFSLVQPGDKRVDLIDAIEFVK
jgi:hypothetical protein